MVPELAVEPQRVELAEGISLVWRATPGLVITRVQGRMRMPHAECIIEAIETAARAVPGEAAVVHDWTEIESYEVAVHARMGAWSVGIMSSLRRVVIAATSPFVTAAVRTVNVAVRGRFELLDSREQVMVAAQEELARSRSTRVLEK